jgi:hypothetical protein
MIQSKNIFFRESFGPLVMHIETDGFVVNGARAEFGFACRKILSDISARPWRARRHLWSHLFSESALTFERLFSQVIEGGLMVHVSKRAESVRDLLVQLSDCARMLRCVSGAAQALGLAPLQFYCQRMREEIFDLLELMTGSRHGFYFIVPGGVRWDLSAGFLARCESWSKKVPEKCVFIRENLELACVVRSELKTLGRVAFWRSNYQETSAIDRLMIMVSDLVATATKIGEISMILPGGTVHTSLEQEHEWRNPLQVFDSKLVTVRGEFVLTGRFASPDLIKSLNLVTPSSRASQWAQEALLNCEPHLVQYVLESLDISACEVDQ